MSKYEIVTINNKLVSIDLSELIKKENIFFNATQIAKQFGRLPADYLRLDATKEYISAVSSQYGISHSELISVTNGGKYKGTWLHQKLAIDFARWCSPEFAVQLDAWIISKLQNEKQRKHERELARLEYPDMTDAIKDNLMTGRDSDQWQYVIEADMINLITLGCKAKKYCEDNDIDRTNLRSSLPIKQISIIHELQKTNTVLINIGMDRPTRKLALQQQYHKLIQKLLS